MIAPRFKLLWDYRGPDGAGTAAHFERHLVEFLARHDLQGETGVEVHSPNHASAWYAGDTPVAEQVLKALRPHRAEPLGPA